MSSSQWMKRACVHGAACWMMTWAACIPEDADGVHASRDAEGAAYADFGLDDAARFTLDATAPLSDDAPMERPDFTMEASSDRVEVHAAGRALVPLRLLRTGGHRAWIELRVSGLPPHVSGFFAVSPEADHVVLVVEASDQAAQVTLAPFTLEANGEGLRRTRRMALTVLPEKEVEE